MPSISVELASLFGGGSGAGGGLPLAFARTLLDGCMSETQILAPLVLLNAALVRALSLRLGQNVLATVVEALVAAFEKAHERAVHADDGQEHACCNAALLLAHLYNFGAVHATLLYELIRRLVASFSEAELQVLITILRAIGPQLRADDPLALKSIIVDVQSRATAAASGAGTGGAGTGGTGPSSGAGGVVGQTVRAKVFISMLTDLKNNKQKAREQGAADGALGRLKKWLKQLTSSGGMQEPPPFKVGWAELVEAEVHGRWWIVGSA